MKARIIILAALGLGTLGQADPHYQALIIDGVTYSNVTITRIESGNAICIHKKGVDRIALTHLPTNILAEIQTAFGVSAKPQTQEDEVDGGFGIRVTADSQVERHYNKFNESTLYHLERQGIETKGTDRSMTFSASCIIAPTTGTLYAAGAVEFDAYKKASEIESWDVSGIWPHAENHHLILLVDGKRRDLGNTEYKHTITDEYRGESFYVENMHVMVPIPVLRQLQASTTVEFQLGPTEGRLDKDQQKRIKALLNRVSQEFTNVVEVTNGKQTPQD